MQRREGGKSQRSAFSTDDISTIRTNFFEAENCDSIVLISRLRKALEMCKNINQFICDQNFSFLATHKPIFDEQKLISISMLTFAEKDINCGSVAHYQARTPYTGSYLNEVTFNEDWNVLSKQINKNLRGISHVIRQENQSNQLETDTTLDPNSKTKIDYIYYKSIFNTVLVLILGTFLSFILISCLWYGSRTLQQYNTKTISVTSFKFPNGDFYTGQLLNDEPHGIGEMIFSSGDIYEGNWKNGLRNGNGTYSHRHNVYSGEWVNDKRNGFGVETHPNGVVFKGRWRDGKRDGKGELIKKSGEKYVGNWVLGEMDGKFIVINKEGINEVEWYKNGKRDNNHNNNIKENIKSFEKDENDENGENFIMELTDGNYLNWMKNNKYVFVNFCDPRALLCQRLEPEWNLLAEKMTKDNIPVSIAKVNCVLNKNFCVEQKVQAFPTLRFFINDNGVYDLTDYRSDRKLKDFVNFIDNTVKNWEVKKETNAMDPHLMLHVRSEKDIQDMKKHKHQNKSNKRISFFKSKTQDHGNLRNGGIFF